jgi:hypothetical protein
MKRGSFDYHYLFTPEVSFCYTKQANMVAIGKKTDYGKPRK